jgi:hypothetical protein
VDARRPHPRGNPLEPEGYSTIALIFQEGCNAAAISATDLSVSCHPPVAGCPTISTIQSLGSILNVKLSGVIPAETWTCVRHGPSGPERCVGSLPGDVSGNGTTVPADIIDLIDHLNGIRVPLLTIEHCDLDRSGLCLPADIITMIDLLNGNGFSNWNGRSLPACPSQ